MKICRFQPVILQAPESRSSSETYPAPIFGIVEDSSVRECSGDFAAGWKPGSRTWPLGEVKLLPP
jgi:hypothetical protein